MVPEILILSIPVIVPEAVELQEVTSVSAELPAQPDVEVEEESSSDEQAPKNEIIPIIRVKKISALFICPH